MTAPPCYASGDWFAVVAPGRAALLDPATPPATVRALWSAGPGLAAGLAELVAHGLAGLPSFVLLDTTGPTPHVVLRGEARLLRGSERTWSTVEAGGVDTWTELVLDGAELLALVGAGVPGEGSGPGGASGPCDDGLPLVSGVVRARWLRVPSVAGVPAAGRVPVGDAAPMGPGPVVGGSVAGPSAGSAPGAPVPLLPVDDHDGLTILSGELASIRERLPGWPVDGAGTPVPVLATPAALTARLVLSTGTVVPLDRGVLIGRAPEALRMSVNTVPRLVPVPSPQQDISRTHVEVHAEGAQVLVTDLDSTNGTVVAAADGPVRRLRPGEAVALRDGETVDLGDGVTFTVERGT